MDPIIIAELRNRLLGELKWQLPSQSVPVERSPVPLSTGLHLMHGGKASGKTLTALALALQLKEAGVSVKYEYVMEPRADAAQLIEMQTADRYQSILDGWLGDCRGGVLIMDSLTYLLQKLPDVETQLEVLGTQTYEKGLTPGVIFGVLLLDSRARAAGTCLIGTLNTELVPAVERLEGACEGEMKITAPGVFMQRDRITRVAKELTPGTLALEQAKGLLGYNQTSGPTGLSGADIE